MSALEVSFGHASHRRQTSHPHATRSDVVITPHLRSHSAQDLKKVIKEAVTGNKLSASRVEATKKASTRCFDVSPTYTFTAPHSIVDAD